MFITNPPRLSFLLLFCIFAPLAIPITESANAGMEQTSLATIKISVAIAIVNDGAIRAGLA
ncbi:hypothetical protein [Treponema zioleckii]|uniref:hypothetical protein n=1 Tax=Treponema zioleckii TaxID=331680 RepID=UPI00168BC1D3|nr:hypothetical protein [Treponema zioleckii]